MTTRVMINNVFESLDKQIAEVAASAAHAILEWARTESEIAGGGDVDFSIAIYTESFGDVTMVGYDSQNDSVYITTDTGEEWGVFDAMNDEDVIVLYKYIVREIWNA